MRLLAEPSELAELPVARGMLASGEPPLPGDGGCFMVKRLVWLRWTDWGWLNEGYQQNKLEGGELSMLEGDRKGSCSVCCVKMDSYMSVSLLLIHFGCC